MLRGWRGRRLRSKYPYCWVVFPIGKYMSDVIEKGCSECVLTMNRARLAKIKQNQAKAIGKRGKMLGRKFAFASG